MSGLVWRLAFAGCMNGRDDSLLCHVACSKLLSYVSDGMLLPMFDNWKVSEKQS
jgi:hypothetical protein